MKTHFRLLTRLTYLTLAVLLTSAGYRSSPPSGDVPQKVAASLSTYFRKDLKPLETAQIETMTASAFTAWLQRATLSDAQKNSIRQLLTPLLSAGKAEIIHIKKAKAAQGMAVHDVVLIQVPNNLVAQLQGSNYVTIFEGNSNGGSNPVEICYYLDCSCTNKTSPGSCDRTMQFNKNCPPSECPASGGTCDCGGGGVIGLANVFETLFG